MTVLDMDAGNTRIKWRLTGSADGQAGVTTTSESGWIDSLLEAIGQADAVPERIRISSVRDGAFNKLLQDRLFAACGVVPEFAVVSRFCAEVTNSYEDVSRMGVDRWLAMLAAYEKTQGACCIVDAGSAVTVDLISSGGLHEGGYIVPGLAMMLSALQQRSSALDYVQPPAWSSTEPGTGTREAIEHGLLSMLSGWLTVLGQENSGRQYLVTGGDGNTLLSHMSKDMKYCPDLVLDGLALALP